MYKCYKNMSKVLLIVFSFATVQVQAITFSNPFGKREKPKNIAFRVFKKTKKCIAGSKLLVSSHIKNPFVVSGTLISCVLLYYLFIRIVRKVIARDSGDDSFQYPQAISPLFLRECLFGRKCPICLDEKLESVQLNCGHNICGDCLAGLVNIALKDKSTQGIKCPYPECREKISAESLEYIASGIGISQKELSEVIAVERYESAKKLPGFRHCPTPNCKHYFVHRNQKRKKICPECSQKYCTNCLRDHWSWKSCAKSEKEKEQNENWLRKHSKMCPNCNVFIEKRGGCDHIHCNCGCDFCYRCGFYSLHGWSDHRCSEDAFIDDNMADYVHPPEDWYHPVPH